MCSSAAAGNGVVSACLPPPTEPGGRWTVKQLRLLWKPVFSSQVAKQLKEQQMVMRGHRDTSMVHELNR